MGTILSYYFLETEHPIAVRTSAIGIIRIGMMAVEILHDVETAAVDIEVDVALIEIGCVGFPDRHFGVQLFDKAPGGITDALAVNLGVDKQQLQFAAPAFHADNGTADLLPVEENSEPIL